MVKPPKEGAALRRVGTISLYALSFLLLSGSALLWLPAAWVIGLLRQRSFVLLRLLVFAWFYFGFELVALIRVAVTRLRYDAADPRCQSEMLILQSWWAAVLLGVVQRFLKLDFDIRGAEEAAPGPAILLIRHASILDTILPCVFLQRPTNWRVRYILKQELLFDPCVDVVGNILPNYFVDRTGDRRQELEGIRSLVEELGSDGVLIFPEGTRFSKEKRRQVLETLGRDSPELRAQAETFERVLPPKPGGVLALVDALPEVDCVFFAHAGLESFAKIKDLLSGDIVGSTVAGSVWRIPAAQIPKEADERLLWLYAQWARVSRWVSTHTQDA